MVEKFGTVKNQLTIIAIFAGVAEISGTGILPFIAPNIQELYVWFLMIFPFTLVVIFFATLNLNHKVLYAPSDYKDENNFVKSFETASPEDTFNKNNDEIDAMASEEFKKLSKKEKKYTAISYERIIKNDIRATYLLAEELVFAKLQQEFNGVTQREIVINKNPRFVFDGAITSPDGIKFIEVKYARKSTMNRLNDSIRAMEKGISYLDDTTKKKAKFILAIVTEEEYPQTLLHKYFERIKELPASVDLRLFKLSDLEKEFSVQR
ncbi:hypothetical protein [Maridesulfovibrio sp. FT414]|uniref:hypothetical protein n=1 Tax=Maridesulfovibrio sp. FT414 TaxID=2979469 RepID=UPI003D8059D5